MTNQNKNVIPTRNKLYWVYLAGFFLLLFTPFVTLPPWFSPPDWGKSIYFRIIFSILVFIFLWQILLRKREKVFSVDLKNLVDKKSNIFWPFWLLVALLGVYFLATVFSLDVRFSFWGDPYRAGGFLNFAFLLTFGVSLFLILKQRDWQKIWNFSIFVGLLISTVAIFAQFGILSKIFIPQKTQIAATLGGPTFVGLYFLLLLFLTISFAIKEKVVFKKVLYSLTSLLFLYIIFITISQAAYLGAAFGLLYFLFFYPKKLLLLKGSVLLAIVLAVLGVYHIKSQPENPLNKNYLFSTLTRWHMDESRISTWKISLEAVKSRPILGYGPENFSIGFDKYYDPSLPGIARNPEQFTSWWDRAHNIVFDISVSAGIPALLIYLSLFAVLFFKLRKLKKDNIVAHGIQTAFIAYFIDNIFSFDTFSIYLLLFVIVGYSLALLNQNNALNTAPVMNKTTGEPKSRNYLILFFSFLIIVWFVWFFNIKPFRINSQINIAQYLVKQQNCEEAFSRMEKVLPQHTFLDAYFSSNYINYIKQCDAIKASTKALEYATKGREMAKQAAEKRPFYTRAWIFLGSFDNVLIEKTNKQIANEQSESEKQKEQAFVQDLTKEADSAFGKATSLSPKKQEIFSEWAKTELVKGDYQKMKERAQYCLSLNPNLKDCHWILGLAEIYLGNFEQGKEELKIAGEHGYYYDEIPTLHELVNAYAKSNNYKELALVYEELVNRKPLEPQYHASLAFTYKELGQYEKARKEASKVLELQPDAKDEVEAFLKTLK